MQMQVGLHNYFIIIIIFFWSMVYGMPITYFKCHARYEVSVGDNLTCQLEVLEADMTIWSVCWNFSKNVTGRTPRVEHLEEKSKPLKINILLVCGVS